MRGFLFFYSPDFRPLETERVSGGERERESERERERVRGQQRFPSSETNFAATLVLKLK
jgi:hypothetical protein